MSLMINQALCMGIEALINRLLAHDPSALSRLNELAGKQICIHISPLGQCHVRIEQQAIAISTQIRATPDVTLSGSLSEFIELSRAQNTAQALMQSNILMQGDTEIAKRLARIAQTLNIDWEAAIAPLTGGLIAHQVGKGIRGLGRWIKSSAPTYKSAVSTYLEDESQILASKVRVEEFNDRISALKMSSERLEARINAALTSHQQESDS